MKSISTTKTTQLNIGSQVSTSLIQLYKAIDPYKFKNGIHFKRIYYDIGETENTSWMEFSKIITHFVPIPYKGRKFRKIVNWEIFWKHNLYKIFYPWILEVTANKKKNLILIKEIDDGLYVFYLKDNTLDNHGVAIEIVNLFQDRMNRTNDVFTSKKYQNETP